MSGQFDYWGLLAGIALFLFAMAQLESGLKSLGGRSLAFYLKSQADRRINSVIGGIVSTARRVGGCSGSGGMRPN